MAAPPLSPSPRSYRQFCALARALDTIGERWTLLLVRELLLGPRRFGDLLDGLPGIGPNLLSRRLRRLQREGLVEQQAPEGSAASHLYALTDRGRGLDDALLALARWGMEPIGPPRRDDRFDPGWYALALRAAFRPERAGRHDETYELRIDEVPFHLAVRHGRAQARRGPAERPAVVLATSVERFLALLTGQADPRPGEVSDDAGFDRLRAAFPLPLPAGPSPARP